MLSEDEFSFRALGLKLHRVSRLHAKSQHRELSGIARNDGRRAYQSKNQAYLPSQFYHHINILSIYCWLNFYKIMRILV